MNYSEKKNQWTHFSSLPSSYSDEEPAFGNLLLSYTHWVPLFLYHWRQKQKGNHLCPHGKFLGDNQPDRDRSYCPHVNLFMKGNVLKSHRLTCCQSSTPMFAPPLFFASERPGEVPDLIYPLLTDLLIPEEPDPQWESTYLVSRISALVIVLGKGYITPLVEPISKPQRL